MQDRLIFIPEDGEEPVEVYIVEDEQELSAVLLMMREALEELGIEILE